MIFVKLFYISKLLAQLCNLQKIFNYVNKISLEIGRIQMIVSEDSRKKLR